MGKSPKPSLRRAGSNFVLFKFVGLGWIWFYEVFWMFMFGLSGCGIVNV